MAGKKFFNDIDLNGNRLINVGPTNATIESGLGSGGSDPLLESRVEKLENQTASILYPFNDNFDTDDFIDWAASTNVTRVSNGSDTYVAINPLTVTSNVNLQTDANGAETSSVEYSSGAVKNVSQTIGVYTSKYLNINASTQAQIDATFLIPSVYTFGDETVSSTSGLNTNIINFYTVADNTTRWFFYQTTTGYGEVYGWAVDITNGTTVMSHRRIGQAGPSGTLSNTFRSLSAKIDNSGNVWLAAWRYIGGTAATNSRCAVYKILKSNTSTDAFADESRALVVGSAIASIDTFYDSDNNRFHAGYITLSNTQGAIVFYNGSTNSFLSQTNFSFSFTTTSNYQLKLVKSSNASKEIAIFASRTASTSNALNGIRYTIDTSLTYGAITQNAVSLLTNSSSIFDVVFSESLNAFTGLHIRNNGTTTDLFRITSNFSSSSSYSVASTLTLSISPVALKTSTIAIDDTHLIFSYLGTDPLTSYQRPYLSRIRISDGAFSNETNGFLQQPAIGTGSIVNFNLTQPVLENNNGKVSLFYVKETGNPSNLIGNVIFGLYNSDLKLEAQMPTGTWVEIYNNQSGLDLLNESVILASTKQTQIRFKLTMGSPNASNAQTTVSEFSATVPGSDSTGILVSKPLVTGKPITKVSLSPNLTLGDGINGINGTVSFQVSNNGGASLSDWFNYTLGTDYLFNTVGTELRVKASITIPTESAGFSPRINGYGGTAGNIAQQSDLVILNVNLMKTTLQLNTLLTANRLAWTNMMIDTFQTGDGVTLGAGLSLNSGTIAGTGTVTSVMELAEINPVNSIVVVAEYEGTATFEVSRDGGVSWPYLATPNSITVLDGTESIKNQIRIRANLTSGTLYGWAYLYA